MLVLSLVVCSARNEAAQLRSDIIDLFRGKAARLTSEVETERGQGGRPEAACGAQPAGRAPNGRGRQGLSPGP